MPAYRALVLAVFAPGARFIWRSVSAVSVWPLFSPRILVVAVLVTGGAIDSTAGQRTDGQRQGEAARLAQQAVQLFGDGRYQDAMELAALSVEAVDRRTGRETAQDGVALTNVANLYGRRGDAARAEALCLRALGIYAKTLPPEHPEVATTLNNLGSLHESKGDYSEAERLYLRSLAIDQKTRGADSTDVATTLGNIGGLHVRRGDYPRAEEYLARAYEIDRRKLPPGHPDIARDLNNLGTLYMYKGEPARAEQMLAEALGIIEKTPRSDTLLVASLLHNLGTVRYMKGQHGRAETDFLRAQSIREAAFGSRHPDVVLTLNNLGLVYQATGNFARANEIYTRALPLAEEVLGSTHPLTGTMLNNITVVLTSLGSTDRAEVMGLRSLAIQEEMNGLSHPDVALPLNNLALLYQRRREYARAQTMYERAIAIDEKALGQNHPTVARLLSNLALLYAAKGDVAEAVRLMARNGNIHETNLHLMMSAGSEDEKRSYLDTLANDTFAAISLHAVEAPNDRSAARLALTTVLQRKGRVLDTMADQIGGLRRRLNAPDQALLNQLSDVRARLARHILWSGEEPSATGAASAPSLLAEAERLERQLGERSAAFRVTSRPIDLERVQATIPLGAALVEIALFRPLDVRSTTEAQALGASRYIAYTLTREGTISFADVGEAGPIDRVVLALRASLSDPRRTDVRSVARRLDEMVMRPIRKTLGGARTLLVSPDGALNLVPFAALIDERDRYLVQDYTITYLTSGRDLLRLSDGAARGRPPVVVANPAFDRSDAESRDRSAGSASSRRSTDLAHTRWTPLTGTGDEAAELARLLPDAVVLTREAATETALKAISGPRILHIATHGFFLSDSSEDVAPMRRAMAPAGLLQTVPPGAEQPLLRSGLILAGANVQHSGARDDGVLTALEVSGLDLWGTELVVLSACETGLGDVKNGEGVFGLRRALVLAGAASQLVTLWKVDDLATRDLVVDYYRRLQRGEGRSEALRRVQVAMLTGEAPAGTTRDDTGALPARRPGDYAHPFYWASFLSVGEWRPFSAVPVPR